MRIKRTRTHTFRNLMADVTPAFPRCALTQPKIARVTLFPDPVRPIAWVGGGVSRGLFVAPYPVTITYKDLSVKPARLAK